MAYYGNTDDPRTNTGSERDDDDDIATQPPQTTRQVLSWRITLTPGRRYVASRPMASRLDEVFPIAIRDITDGPTTHVGRVWE